MEQEVIPSALQEDVLSLRPGDRLRDPQADRGYLVFGVRVYDDFDNALLDTYYDLISEDGLHLVLQALAVSPWERL